MAATFLALCLFCAGNVLAILLSNAQWAKSHAWLAPWFEGATMFFGLLAVSAWWFGEAKAPTQDAQSSTGHSSPNIVASQGGTVNVTIGGQQDATQQRERRPYVRPVEYSRLSDAEALMTGYRELVRVSNEGSDAAHQINIEAVRLGSWNAEFEPCSYLRGLDRIKVSVMSKTTYVNGQPHIATKQKLEEVWADADKTHGPIDKVELRIRYRDHREKPFLSSCSIQRAKYPNGIIFFRLSDFSDEPVEPIRSRGGGLYSS